MHRDSPLSPSQRKDQPPESPPPLTRSSQARVSFREPISSSYSVEDDEEEEEDENQEERLQVSLENKQGVDDDDDGEDGGFGRGLNLQKGIPPQMDLLGKQNPLTALCAQLVHLVLFNFYFLPQLDGSSYLHHHLKRGWGRCRTSFDPVPHLGSERRLRSSRSERPRLDTLDLRGEKGREGRSSCSIPSLSLQQRPYKHDDSCSTCSSSSDSEEEGFFLGQRIPLPPQLRQQQQPEECRPKRAEVGPQVQRDQGLRGSIRRSRAFSQSAKDKDKNCAVS